MELKLCCEEQLFGRALLALAHRNISCGVPEKSSSARLKTAVLPSEVLVSGATCSGSRQSCLRVIELVMARTEPLEAKHREVVTKMISIT